MVELAIEIPDEPAQRLIPLQNQLLQLLKQLLETTALSLPPQPKEPLTSASEGSAVYQEVLDFLIARPTPIEISAFKVSSQSQKRLQVLLEKNRQGTLTALETAELDVFEQFDHLVMLLKARAYAAIH
ncbi:hypothetical protein [Lusitaniella coriacea]|uniref:hypothetical protein n=1 Tax=Lusitaniella coriacea TaxID=1983105 RepID=UPI003CF27391